MKLDLNPGKHASETGQWYLSCDDGDSVLVGMQHTYTDEEKEQLRKRDEEHDRVMLEKWEKQPSPRPEYIGWTCPVIGLQKYDIPMDKFIELEQASIITCGAAEEAGSLWRIEEKVARKILARDPIAGPFEAEEDTWADTPAEEYGRDIVWCGTDSSNTVDGKEYHTIIVIGGMRFE